MSTTDNTDIPSITSIIRPGPQNKMKSNVLVALSDPSCRKIMNLLSKHQMNYEAICISMNLASSTVYRKIALLTKWGLIKKTTKTIKKGKQKYHNKLYFCDIKKIYIELESNMPPKIKVVRHSKSEVLK